MEILKDIGFKPPERPEEVRVQTVALMIKTFDRREVIVDHVVVNPSMPSDPDMEIPMPESI